MSEFWYESALPRFPVSVETGAYDFLAKKYGRRTINNYAIYNIISNYLSRVQDSVRKDRATVAVNVNTNYLPIVYLPMPCTASWKSTSHGAIFIFYKLPLN